MEGMHNNQPHQVRQQPPAAAHEHSGSGNGGGSSSHQQPPQQPNREPQRTVKWYEPTLESKTVVVIIMLAAVVVLVSFAASLFSRSVETTDFVNEDQYQAVFLTNGQVYFGNITGANTNSMVLENIYYLQVDEQIQPEGEDVADDPQVSLTKLGEELHGPEDQMFINMNEVLFWENLREDGDVSQAIDQFESGEAQDLDGDEMQRLEDHEGAEEDLEPEDLENELEEE